MPEIHRRAWTPEKVIPKIPREKIQHSPLFLRRGEFADNKTYVEVVRGLLPETRWTKFEDGESFRTFLADVAHRSDNVLAILEATTVMVPHSCIDALRDAVKIADQDNRLKERVIPVLVVDEEWAHTKYFQSEGRNPDGPRHVMERGKELGAIVVKVTAPTLRARLMQTLGDILQGVVPAT